VRSFDKGKTWSKPEKLFDLGNADHRCTPLLQISNGDLVGGDYRIGASYNQNGKFDNYTVHRAPSLWGVWSEDRGKTWNFTKEPLTVPGTEFMYAEIERPIIELPDGRLLMAANYCLGFDAGASENDENLVFAIGIWCSDNKGRSWEYLSSTELYDVALPHIECEPTIIRCRSGKLVMLMRNEKYMVTDWEKKGAHLQSESYDDGKTWTKPHLTELSSQSTPPHLTLLADGRLLVTHASRQYPGSIYLTVSDDEGETWDTRRTKIVTQDLPNFDSTYPTTVQFSDGSLITVWYNNRFGKFHIGYAKYCLEDL
jgi:Neuraminidase (sialidase)